VGIAYSLKFSGRHDGSVDLPLFKRLDMRGWMMFLADRRRAARVPGRNWQESRARRLGALALVVAFAAANKTLWLMAWRIERQKTEKNKPLALLSIQLRLALLTRIPLSSSLPRPWAGACPMYLWRMYAIEYSQPGLLKNGARGCGGQKKTRSATLDASGFFDAIVGPFIAFFRAHAGRAGDVGGNQPYRLPTL